MAFSTDNTVFCYVRLISSLSNIVNHPQNQQYLLAPQARHQKKSRRTRADTPPIEPLELALRLEKTSMQNPSRGHYFGSDAYQSDVLLDVVNEHGVSGIHFRLCLDYTRDTPDAILIYNASQHGTMVNSALLTRVQHRLLYPGQTVRLQAGPVHLELRFPTDELDLDAWADLCAAARKTQSSSSPVRHVHSRRQTPKYHHSDEQWASHPDIRWATGHKYRVWAPLISSGRYATIRKAHRLSDRLVVAVKYITEEQDRRFASIERSPARELRIMASLDHPNITKLLDHAFYRGGALLLVQEFAHFGSLDEYLGNNYPLEEDKCKAIVAQVLEGTQYLHQNNIIHRDINPNNILVFSREPGFLCKLTDFGLAEEVTLGCPARDIDVAKGSMAYMALEVALGLDCDHKADIYACGKVAYRMLTGGEGIQRVTTLAQLPPLLTEWNPRVALQEIRLTGSCRDMLCDMLANEPSKRPTAAYCLKGEWLQPSEKIGNSNRVRGPSGNGNTTAVPDSGEADNVGSPGSSGAGAGFVSPPRQHPDFSVLPPLSGISIPSTAFPSPAAPQQWASEDGPQNVEIFLALEMQEYLDPDVWHLGVIAEEGAEK